MYMILARILRLYKLLNLLSEFCLQKLDLFCFTLYFLFL